MTNPLETGDQFYMTLANPNPTSSKTKDGPVYRVSFELTQEEWQQFMDAETKGMILECACQVAHNNEPSHPAVKEAVKGGPLSKRAATLCRDPWFAEFAADKLPPHVNYEDTNEGLSKALIYYVCGVTSRAQLDHDEAAKEKFTELLGRYTRWSQGEKVA